MKTTNEMIGQCGFGVQNCEERQILEIGYLLQKADWHQGYASEAAIACQRYAFEQLKRKIFYGNSRK